MKYEKVVFQLRRLTGSDKKAISRLALRQTKSFVRKIIRQAWQTVHPT